MPHQHKNSWLLQSALYATVVIIALMAPFVGLVIVDTNYVEGRTIFYYGSAIVQCLALLVLPLFIVVSLIKIWRASQQTNANSSHRSPWFRLFLLICANLVACGASAPGLLTLYTNLESKVWDNHLYRLDMQYLPGSSSIDSYTILLWECDQMGLFCRVVHLEHRYGAGSWRESSKYSAMIAELSPHLWVDDNTMNVVIHEQIVYRYTSVSAR